MFATPLKLQPCLIFEGKVTSPPERGALDKARLLALSVNIRQGLGVDISDKHSSLFGRNVSDEENCLMLLTPGHNFIELFTAVIYECSQYAGVSLPRQAFPA